uniref:Uncharacterized protein n=1 Tax=Leersia perrieri TaxID=77586 RepID=A0A0D9WQW2_9ORYZ
MSSSRGSSFLRTRREREWGNEDQTLAKPQPPSPAPAMRRRRSDREITHGDALSAPRRDGRDRSPVSGRPPHRADRGPRSFAGGGGGLTACGYPATARPASGTFLFFINFVEGTVINFFEEVVKNQQAVKKRVV